MSKPRHAAPKREHHVLRLDDLLGLEIGSTRWRQWPSFASSPVSSTPIAPARYAGDKTFHRTHISSVDRRELERLERAISKLHPIAAAEIRKDQRAQRSRECAIRSSTITSAFR